MLKHHYKILRNHFERFEFKHNLKLSRPLKAKLLYLGGNEFIRCQIDEAWRELIKKDPEAFKIEESGNWDLILEKLKKRGTGYFQNIPERLK